MYTASQTRFTTLNLLQADKQEAGSNENFFFSSSTQRESAEDWNSKQLKRESKPSAERKHFRCWPWTWGRNFGKASSAVLKLCSKYYKKSTVPSDVTKLLLWTFEKKNWKSFFFNLTKKKQLLQAFKIKVHRWLERNVNLESLLVSLVLKLDGQKI